MGQNAYSRGVVIKRLPRYNMWIVIKISPEISKETNLQGVILEVSKNFSLMNNVYS